MKKVVPLNAQVLGVCVSCLASSKSEVEPRAILEKQKNEQANKRTSGSMRLLVRLVVVFGSRHGLASNPYSK